METSKDENWQVEDSDYPTKTFTLYLVARYSAHAEGNVAYDLLDYKTTSADYTVLAEYEYPVVLPKIEVVNKALIVVLEAKRKEMRAAASAAITEVDNTIASLLALEHIA